MFFDVPIFGATLTAIQFNDRTNGNLSDRLKNLFWSLFITMIDLSKSLLSKKHPKFDPEIPGIGLIRSNHDKVIKLHPYQTLHLALWNAHDN